MKDLYSRDRKEKFTSAAASCSALDKSLCSNNKTFCRNCLIFIILMIPILYAVSNYI